MTNTPDTSREAVEVLIASIPGAKSLQEVYDLQDKNAQTMRALLSRAEKAEAENERLRAAQAWQPIKTAPRDGTKILSFVWTIYQGGVVVAHWDDNDGFIDCDSDFWEPTHWLPLPEPPTP
jgi:hypothetical protein